LPGKLELDVGGLPLLARVYRNLGGDTAREAFLSCKATLPPELDALLLAPAVVDRWSQRGPLGGMISTMTRMRSRWVYVSAGDTPFVNAAFVASLAAERRPGDEAVVPVHDVEGKALLEPLAALYDRLAFLREGVGILRSGRGALRLVIERLAARRVPAADPRVFTNVNTLTEYRGLS